VILGDCRAPTDQAGRSARNVRISLCLDSKGARDVDEAGRFGEENPAPCKQRSRVIPDRRAARFRAPDSLVESTSENGRENIVLFYCVPT
jgi:hypothetical protein